MGSLCTRGLEDNPQEEEIGPLLARGKRVKAKGEDMLLLDFRGWIIDPLVEDPEKRLGDR